MFYKKSKSAAKIQNFPIWEAVSICVFYLPGIQITPPWPPLKGRSLLLALNRNDYRDFSLPSPFGEGPGGKDYRTFTLTPAECDWNSGAYMHSMCVMPLLKSPDCVAKRVYSKTYLPFGIQSMKKWVAASLVDS